MSKREKEMSVKWTDNYQSVASDANWRLENPKEIDSGPVCSLSFSFLLLLF